MGSRRQALILLSLFSSLVFAKEEKPVLADLMSKAAPSDWRALDFDNTLYFDFDGKRVVIELAPDFAPKSVANVKALAAEHYWDGLAIVRVQVTATVDKFFFFLYCP